MDLQISWLYQVINTNHANLWLGAGWDWVGLGVGCSLLSWNISLSKRGTLGQLPAFLSSVFTKLQGHNPRSHSALRWLINTVNINIKFGVNGSSKRIVFYFTKKAHSSISYPDRCIVSEWVIKFNGLSGDSGQCIVRKSFILTSNTCLISFMKWVKFDRISWTHCGLVASRVLIQYKDVILPV